LQLMNAWPDFRMATNRSNKQVGAPLSLALCLSCLPAVAGALWGALTELESRGSAWGTQAHSPKPLQVLEPLGWSDILLVAVISGFSEEALFRGAVIPASFPDWRGALLSGAIFGILHNNGGRNLAFAAWASAVGALYGGLFVYTHNIWVPITAHAAANFCSAAVWKSNRQGNGATSSSF
jgi:membrane protease YdiL (CAAX protease family)